MRALISIIPFEAGLAHHFVRLNKAWIERYFKLEPADETVFQDPQLHIIDQGGFIYFAVYNGAIAGTFALQRKEAATLELSKMAVDENFRGQQIGHVLMEAAIATAKAKGANKLVLYSNTALQPAIHLYRKFGFKEVPLEHTDFERANIKMEKVLTPGPSPQGEGSGVLHQKVSTFHHQASPLLFAFAKEQRQEGTAAEQLMWQQLRNRQLEGWKFRRQHPIGPYIVDFYCHEMALVIEIDGSIHQQTAHKDYDAARDQFLKEEGLQVLRFSNAEIYNDISKVLHKIRSFIAERGFNNNQTINT